jgi:hypothetical protein
MVGKESWQEDRGTNSDHHALQSARVRDGEDPRRLQDDANDTKPLLQDNHTETPPANQTKKPIPDKHTATHSTTKSMHQWMVNLQCDSLYQSYLWQHPLRFRGGTCQDKDGWEEIMVGFQMYLYYSFYYLLLTTYPSILDPF